MNKQQVFDTVVAHLRKQGKQAVNNDSKCVLRAPDGSKCAVGCLIPDNQYDPSFESHPLEAVVVLVPRLRKMSVALLCDLQDAHDFYGGIETVLVQQLIRVAGKHKLNPAIVDQWEKALKS